MNAKEAPPINYKQDVYIYHCKQEADLQTQRDRESVRERERERERESVRER